ncbi:hypothetical protein EJ05DRAFT_348213 [Pseudovirgaria hyperparasitica]|uniref:DUF7726 domain-containing protein n=1 Tax=Pseudovirgaria hyperparasitica TaxID=470096 RepID=A0A6A6W8X9_9PEZI|nr:uncharacterized protein EJ05DRAFT_348213 [Pseudovirgaria hyperparasitica]KAF2758346.1 hypothetical protein EJ05DRAFT_348213 [Pseudovirgaria hyperparasitica]
MSKLPPINRQALGQRDSNVQLPPLSSLSELAKKPTDSLRTRPSYLGTILNTEPRTDPNSNAVPQGAMGRPGYAVSIQDINGLQRKRPASTDLASVDADSDDVDFTMGPVLNCNQVRARINNFLDSGEMKVGEFQKAINVSGPSYRNFMGQNGPYKGANSECYHSAWKFFRLRELRGIPMPRKKQKVVTAAGEPAPAPSKAEERAQNAKAVQLPGELEDKVPVYDTCDEIRRKIGAHLRSEGITQAQFLRDLMAQYHTETRKIQSKQLTDFRSKKGPNSGNTSCIYYASYCLFEKIRIAEKKPKSKDRVYMETKYPGGVDTIRPAGRSYFCPQGTVPVQDKYGKVTIVPSGRR